MYCVVSFNFEIYAEKVVFLLFTENYANRRRICCVPIEYP